MSDLNTFGVDRPDDRRYRNQHIVRALIGSLIEHHS
jgi:hypothetical protein